MLILVCSKRHPFHSDVRREIRDPARARSGAGRKSAALCELGDFE